MMSQVKAGHIEALGELYERYKSSLITYFLRLTGNRAASKDLLMNTFERIHKYRKSYREEGTFRSWCFQIANNLTKDYFKKRGNLIAHYNLDSGEGLTVIDDSDEIGLAQQSLYAALNSLPELDKRIVTQYYLLELPYSEIAILEEITVNTARIRVCRALKQLKNYLKDEENGIG